MKIIKMGRIEEQYYLDAKGDYVRRTYWGLGKPVLVEIRIKNKNKQPAQCKTQVEKIS